MLLSGLSSRVRSVGALLLAALSIAVPVFAAPTNPIVFVTQVPQPEDFATIGSVFANHLADVQSAPRGGDLYIRYPNGTLKNLTQAAGYGVNGFQGSSAIAVRDPAVHWSGNKVIFSMVIGGSAQRYQFDTYQWQLYEATGLGAADTPVITKVPNQPEGYNNVMPAYATTDRIVFVTDRPRNGAAHLYPQLDEYESTATNTGLWSLDPTTGDLALLDHSPSGAFHPTIDSAGRVIYTRWDHLQRDQQADAGGYGAFNYSGEGAGAVELNHHNEIFPEPRAEAERTDPNLNLHTLNHFFPWEINEDGTAHETLNHVGRHELHDYFDRSFNNDGNLTEFLDDGAGRANQNQIFSMLQIREDPLNPGYYFGIDAPEFRTHAAGQVIRLRGEAGLHADQMTVSYTTHRDTSSYTDTPDPTHSGLYRNPLPLVNGELAAVHTSETREERNDGTRQNPSTRYAFRLKLLQKPGAYYVSGAALTPGISKAVTYFDPDELVSYSGNLWELQPVELVARDRPAARQSVLPDIEASVFSNEGVELAAFREYLRENNLAVIVSRNVTSRDATDKQQPFNLRVPGTDTETIAAGGKAYDVSDLQIFQGDQIRGYQDFSAGRRVIPQPLHAIAAQNPESPGAPEGSVKIARDGSVAAFVPARRALTWQLTDPNGSGVVRERYWLTFQPGEIRVCTSCHGLNSTDQIGRGEPENVPRALKLLLDHWRGLPPSPAPIARISAQSREGGRKGTLKSGRPSVLLVRGENGSAASKTMQLGFTVGGKSCGVQRKTFVTDDNGEAALSGSAPRVRNRTPFAIVLYYQGEKIAAGRAKILPGGAGARARKKRKLSKKARASTCRSLLGFN